MPKIIIRFHSDTIIIDTWFFFLIMFLIAFSIIFVIVYFFEKNKRIKLKKDEIDTTKMKYIREIPFENLELAFYVGTYYGIIENMSDFIGAMLLKWIKEDKLDIVEVDGKTIIDMTKIFKTNIGFESDIYVKLLAVAGPNRMLEEHEFQRFFKDNEQVLFNLFKKMKRETEIKLEKLGYIEITLTEFGYEKITVSDTLKQKSEELQGLKNFLLDFSNIENKNSIQVHIWDDYLIYAQLFGIADKVEIELKKIYPNYNNTVKLNMAKMALTRSITTSLVITANLFLNMLIGSRRNL